MTASNGDSRSNEATLQRRLPRKRLHKNDAASPMSAPENRPYFDCLAIRQRFRELTDVCNRVRIQMYILGREEDIFSHPKQRTVAKTQRINGIESATSLQCLNLLLNRVYTQERATAFFLPLGGQMRAGILPTRAHRGHQVLRSLLLAAILFLAGAEPAFSDPVTWYVSVVFENGGAASGSFVYDADLNSITDINTVSPFGTFTAVASTFPLRPTELVFVTDSTLTYGVQQFALALDPVNPGLTDAGGLVPIDASLSLLGVICDNACDGITSAGQPIGSGYLTSNPTTTTPEPSSVILLGSGLLGLGCAIPKRAVTWFRVHCTSQATRA